MFNSNIQIENLQQLYFCLYLIFIFTQSSHQCLLIFSYNYSLPISLLSSNQLMGFKKIISKCDLFPHVPTFPYNEESAYQTATGGCISILVIITFIGIFYTTLINTVQLKQVSYNIIQKAEESPSFFATTLEKTFMFAVGIDNLDLNDYLMYFNINMYFRNISSGNNIKQDIQLVPCKKQQWESRGFNNLFKQNSSSQQNSLNLSKWLCPSDSTSLQLQGKYTSQIFKYYKISASKCALPINSSRSCASDQQIKQFIRKYESFNFNYYFINTIINPSETGENYLKTYLEDVNYFPFTPRSGINANLFVSSYQIDTDESIGPKSQMSQKKGGIVLQNAQTHHYQIQGDQYVRFYLRKSPITLTINRSFRKIDDTLSYIGGLFSAMLMFLGIVSLYNEISYGVEIIRNSYYPDKDKPFDGNFLNFLTYLRYLVFLGFDKIGVELDWPQYKNLHNFLQKGQKQLDIRLIIKKILLIQKIGLAVLGEDMFKALIISQPLSLDEADSIRQCLKFYKRYMKQYPNKDNIRINKVQDIYKGGDIIGQNDIILYVNESQLPISRQIRHKQIFNKQVSQIKVMLIRLNNIQSKQDGIFNRVKDMIDKRIKYMYFDKQIDQKFIKNQNQNKQKRKKNRLDNKIRNNGIDKSNKKKGQRKDQRNEQKLQKKQNKKDDQISSNQFLSNVNTQRKKYSESEQISSFENKRTKSFEQQDINPQQE